MPRKKMAMPSSDALWLDKDDIVDKSWEAFQLPDFLNGCKQKHFAAKQVIYRDGDSADSVYAIRGGLVKLLSYLPNGRARIVRLHGKGAWIGLGGLLCQPYEHTAVAIDAVETFCIPVHRLLALKLQEPQQFFQFMEKWYEHLCDADIWIAEFSTGAIKPRVARLIGFLSDIEYGKSSGVVELLTVHEMADILGVTPESVSRILAEFKRVDILHKLGDDLSHELYQLNYQALQTLAMN
jgi:CRP/FNR family transcriptional regulator